MFPEIPIGAAFDVRNGATPASSEESYWDGDIPWVTPADLGRLPSREISGGARSITQQGYASCGTQMVPAGSIILSIRAPIGHLAIATNSLSFNQGCRGLVPRSIVQTNFAYYALIARKPRLEAAGQGTTFIELSRAKLRAERIAFPDLHVQKRIAGFLDSETARIDELIAKKEAFVAVADEHWRARLDSAILGRSDHIGSFQKVDHPTIDQIPCSWTLKPLKYLTDDRRQIMYGIVLPGPSVDDGVMIVKGGDVKPNRLNPATLCRTTVEIESKYERSRLRAGDLAIAIRGGIGDIEIVPSEIEGANLTQDAARIAPRSGVHNTWLRYALRAPSVFAPLEAKTLGAAVRGINIFDLKRVLVPTPPQSDQVAIANRLAAAEETMATLKAKVRLHKQKLHQFRSALITGAVTGQIDVDRWRRRGNRDRRLEAIEEVVRA